MATYIVRRILWVFLLLFVISLLTFIIFSVLPSGDPAAKRAGRQPTAALIASIKKTLGLDKSKPAQFFCYVVDVAPFVKNKEMNGSKCNPVHVQFTTKDHLGMDFGFSYQTDNDVLPDILGRIGITAALAFGAVFIWLLIGIPIGIISAIRTGSLADRLAMGASLVAISAPVYFLGLVGLYLFSNDIGAIKTVKDSGVFMGSGAYQEAHGILGHMHALILPWLVLAASYAAVYARFLRGNLIDVASEDYIRTARAKGLTERKVIFKHALRSAITPIVTLLGLDVAVLLAGNAILTETVFNIPGVGAETFNAIKRSDLPMIQGITLFGAFFIVTLNLAVDVAYAYLDPRVRYE